MFPLHEVCKMLSAAMYILDAVTGLQSKAPKLREVQYLSQGHTQQWAFFLFSVRTVCCCCRIFGYFVSIESTM